MVSPISEEFQTPEEISSRWRSVLCWRNIFNYSSWWFSASGRSRLKAASTGRANSSPCPFYSGIRNSLLKRSSRRRDISFHKSESVLMVARKSFARSAIGQKRTAKSYKFEPLLGNQSGTGIGTISGCDFIQLSTAIECTIENIGLGC